VGAVNLTNEGTLDWAHWGRNSATAFDRKANVTQRITNVTKIGLKHSILQLEGGD